MASLGAAVGGHRNTRWHESAAELDTAGRTVSVRCIDGTAVACDKVVLEDVEPGPLLVVDWVPPQDDGRPMLINFLFDGGRLTDDRVAGMSCNDGEIAAWKFCSRDEYEARLLPHMVRRVDACVDALRSGQTYVLHYGYAPGDVPGLKV